MYHSYLCYKKTKIYLQNENLLPCRAIATCIDRKLKVFSFGKYLKLGFCVVGNDRISHKCELLGISVEKYMHQNMKLHFSQNIVSNNRECRFFFEEIWILLILIIFLIITFQKSRKESPLKFVL